MTLGGSGLIDLADPQQAIRLPTNNTQHSDCIYDAEWSSDESKLAFMAYAPEDNPPYSSSYHLFVMDSDGSNQRKLQKCLVGYGIAWSPDDSEVVCTAYYPSLVAVKVADPASKRSLNSQQRFLRVGQSKVSLPPYMSLKTLQFTSSMLRATWMPMATVSHSSC